MDIKLFCCMKIFDAYSLLVFDIHILDLKSTEQIADLPPAVHEYRLPPLLVVELRPTSFYI